MDQGNDKQHVEKSTRVGSGKRQAVCGEEHAGREVLFDKQHVEKSTRVGRFCPFRPVVTSGRRHDVCQEGVP